MCAKHIIQKSSSESCIKMAAKCNNFVLEVSTQKLDGKLCTDMDGGS